MERSQSDIQKDRRLRRKLLEVLGGARGNEDQGWVGGQFLRDTYGPESFLRERCADDDHLIRLMRDLVMKGMAEERDMRKRRLDRFGIEWLDWRIAARGVSLLDESIPPDADIDDERIA